MALQYSQLWRSAAVRSTPILDRGCLRASASRWQNRTPYPQSATGGGRKDQFGSIDPWNTAADSKFLVDVSVAAPAKIRKRHRVNHVVRSRKWSSASANVNDRRHIWDGFQESPSIFDIHTPSWKRSPYRRLSQPPFIWSQFVTHILRFYFRFVHLNDEPRICKSPWKLSNMIQVQVDQEQNPLPKSPNNSTVPQGNGLPAPLQQ